MRRRFAVVLAGFAAMASFAARGAAAVDPACVYDDSYDAGIPAACIPAACMAHDPALRSVTQAPSGVHVLKMLLNPRYGGLSVTLRWEVGRGAVVRLNDEDYGDPAVTTALAAADVDAILASIRSYSAQTPEAAQARAAAEEESPERLVACPADDYTTIATNASGAVAGYAGFDCRNFWVVQAGYFIEKKIVAADPACATLHEEPRAPQDRLLVVCSRLAGDRMLAARVYNADNLLHPYGNLGYAQTPSDFASHVTPDVHFAIAGETEAQGLDAVSRVIAAWVTRHTVLDCRYKRIMARRDGDVTVTGACSGYVPGSDPESADFTQSWRAEAAGEPKLVSWRFARFVKQD